MSIHWSRCLFSVDYKLTLLGIWIETKEIIIKRKKSENSHVPDENALLYTLHYMRYNFGFWTRFEKSMLWAILLSLFRALFYS